MIYLNFLQFLIRSEDLNNSKHISTEGQNKLMETIFRNVTLEISAFDFNHTLSANLTLEDTVEKYSKQMLELNKLLNSIFLINVKNYVRNYTNQIKEMITKALCETKLVTFSMGKLLTYEDIKRMNERLYKFVLEIKGSKFLNKSNAEIVNFNESEKYIVGNEITKGIIRYFLGKNKINANFSNKLVNSFDFSQAIELRWLKIEQEAQTSLNHLRLRRFINNHTLTEKLGNEVLYNVTRREMETGIRDGKILIDFMEYLRNKTTEINNNAKFERVYEPMIVIYIGVVIVLVVVASMALIYQLVCNRKKMKSYEKF